MPAEENRKTLGQLAIITEFRQALRPPITYGRFSEIISEFKGKYGSDFLNYKEIQEILGLLEEINLQWDPSASNTRRLYGPPREFNPLEIAMAFFEEGYVCFGAALYWNRFTEQSPSHYHIATERKTKANGIHSEEIDDDYLRDQFMKPPRENRRTANFQGYRYTLHQRDHASYLGVIQRKVDMEWGKLDLRYTDLEKTLLDCTVSPELAGGIKNVVESYAVAKSRISMDKLIAYYRKMDYTYPYWQRIGLILDKTSGGKKAERWRNEFGRPKFTFYLDRKYRADWDLDPRWEVAFPKGLFP